MEFDILSHGQNSSFVKNSLEFIDKLKNTSLQDGEIWVSFDAASYFLVWLFYRIWKI